MEKERSKNQNPEYTFRKSILKHDSIDKFYGKLKKYESDPEHLRFLNRLLVANAKDVKT